MYVVKKLENIIIIIIINIIINSKIFVKCTILRKRTGGVLALPALSALQGLRMKDADRSLSMENGSRSNISNSIRLLEWQGF